MPRPGGFRRGVPCAKAHNTLTNPDQKRRDDKGGVGTSKRHAHPEPGAIADVSTAPRQSFEPDLAPPQEHRARAQDALTAVERLAICTFENDGWRLHLEHLSGFFVDE